ncbi:MAG: polysaccharide biosynthesis/export family protein [Marinibacterium sp.]|nr:polysaccharide biosynthesis/export family protein [Marinibacterium sp.]
MCAVAGCGLPRIGPNKSEITRLAETDSVSIIAVDESIAKATSTPVAIGFSQSFLDADTLTPDRIRAGDTLGLTIWENVENGLLAGAGARATQLKDVQVDDQGTIFIPYAGRLRAAGHTPEALRQIITDKLRDQTPDPQVELRRLAGDGATVSLVGAVGAQGVYPIERSTRTLSTMLAQAGGVAVTPEIARITVLRGPHRGEVWFQDLFENPQADIALRGGDRILVEEDTRSYTALGATASQTRIAFETKDLSALEALAQVGGLVPTSSDPKGIFILRNETPQIAAAVLNQPGRSTGQRMVYVINLTAPNGLFVARDFLIRDDDTIYVTEAPYAQWTKSISLLTGGLTPLANAKTLVGG